MIAQNKTIAIIGGGPGGLLLARLLQNQGLQVKVYERDVSEGVRQQGATLDLHEQSGLKALKEAGLMAVFKQHYRPDAGKMRVADKNLNFFIDDHHSGAGYTETRPEIDRGPLRDLLIQSLLPGTIVWDSQFVSMERRLVGGGWKVAFKNGTKAEADLVIGADGANSKVRPYLSDVKPVYSDITMVELNIYQAAKHAPKMWATVKGGKLFILDEQKSIIMSAKADGTLTIYTGCKVAETWVKQSGINFQQHQSVADWFKATYAGWDEQLSEWTDGAFTAIPRPMYHYVDQNWVSTGDLTLIGDAAHRMPPYAGEGVNMALLDALVLSGTLCSDKQGSVKDALEAYEKEMIARAAAVTEDSLNNTVMLHGENALSDMMALMR